jgi:hypothetical protein
MARNVPENKSGFPMLPVLIVVIILAAGLIWWLRRPAPISNGGKTFPTPTATPKSNKPPAMVSYTLYLPNDQALLSRHTVAEKNPFHGTPSWTLKAGRTLELLCQRLKDLPRATKVLNSPKRDAHGVVTVNMSDEFMKLDGAHETTVALVLDAMAKTLGAVDSPDGKPVKMRVLVEGKPIKTLSEFDLSEPWTSTQPEDETAPDAESVQ